VPAISQTPAYETSWHVPECTFAIEWSPAVLEEIRMAAVEAFFSLPHGGVEIGGVLFGTRNGGGVRILASRQLACEHALGPSFTLSERDHEGLRALLKEGVRDLGAQGLEPVGWYHSHTRSEIFLSSPDVAIHNRYFPDPWQVALVLRPHALKLVRAGFFFRESGGYIHADSSYREFLLQPIASAPTPPVEQLVPTPTRRGPVGRPSVAPPGPAPTEIPVPVSLSLTPRRRSWQRIWWTALILALVTGLVAFKKDWIPYPIHRQPAPSLALMAYDLEGQVQIHWDPAAEPIRSATAGTLAITDGAVNAVVPLEKGQLQSGTFSYARSRHRTGPIDVRLAVDQPGGKKFEEFASLVGITPESKPATEPSADTEALRKELHDQAVRTRRLERAIGDMRAQIRREQERRRNEGQPLPNR
jgi:proteasome lid subunit RPN8/RPN11